MTQEEFNARVLAILATEVTDDQKQQSITNASVELSRTILLGLVADLREGWASWPVDERDANLQRFIDSYQQ